MNSVGRTLWGIIAVCSLCNCGTIAVQASTPLSGLPEDEGTTGGTSGGTTGDATTTGGTSTGTTSAGSTTAGGGSTTSGTSTGGSTCTPDTWTNFGEQFFQQNCSGCHGSEFATVAGVSNDAQVQPYLSDGQMPQNTTLDPTTKARILKWLQCGLPQ